MTVAQEGSFTKAAVKLNVSQPAVSQHISELERSTGTRLFERLRGEVVLTEQGRIFQIRAKNILDAYKSASNLFEQVQPTTVRLRASEEVYLYIYKAIELYTSIHPEVQIIRCDDADADISFRLKSAPKIMGGISATHNIISSLYLACQPSETFAQTELFKSLRSFLADFFLI